MSLCRHLHVDAEVALRHANSKFRGRFVAAEQLAREQGQHLAALDAQALDHLWQQVKAAERG